MDADQTAIRTALLKWTDDFNAGRAGEVCALFSPDLRYDYRGQPERNYNDICDLLQRSLNDRTRRYAYALSIKEILLAADLAIVRLIWTLRITRTGEPGETVTQEPGMDVFRKHADGRWTIIRYMAYEAPG